MHDHRKHAALLALALGVLVAIAAPAAAQEPDADDVAPEDEPPRDVGEPDEPADAFEDDGPLENIQEDPTGPAGPIAWWGPLLFALAVVGVVLVFRHLWRGHGRNER